VARFDQRQGFLLSALVHLVILMSLASHPRVGEKETAPSPDPNAAARKVFLPPPAVLRKLMPAPAQRAVRPPTAAPAPVPAPRPTPPPAPEAKDKISIGADRAKGPVILRRDEDVAAMKGKPNATAATPPPPAPMTPSSEVVAKAGDRVETPQAPGFRLPPGVAGDLPRGQDGSRKGAGPKPNSVVSSIDDVVRRMDEAGPHGLPTGTAQRQMGGLSFDPEGADFTAWINQWKNEVYRNWIVPQPAMLGFRGHVDFEFTVERDGKVSSIRLMKSAGQPALDRAAENALRGGQFLPLPSDYRPPRVTINVSFYYNEGPTGS
jgi:periplasmic protein TonB